MSKSRADFDFCAAAVRARASHGFLWLVLGAFLACPTPESPDANRIGDWLEIGEYLGHKICDTAMKVSTFLQFEPRNIQHIRSVALSRAQLDAIDDVLVSAFCHNMVFIKTNIKDAPAFDIVSHRTVIIGEGEFLDMDHCFSHAEVTSNGIGFYASF